MTTTTFIAKPSYLNSFNNSNLFTKDMYVGTGDWFSSLAGNMFSDGTNSLGALADIADETKDIQANDILSQCRIDELKKIGRFHKASDAQSILKYIQKGVDGDIATYFAQKAADDTPVQKKKYVAALTDVADAALSMLRDKDPANDAVAQRQLMRTFAMAEQMGISADLKTALKKQITDAHLDPATTKKLNGALDSATKGVAGDGILSPDENNVSGADAISNFVDFGLQASGTQQDRDAWNKWRCELLGSVAHVVDDTQAGVIKRTPPAK